MFQVAQSGDARFPLGNERIELGNLDGVLALFLFAETEQVSPVRRTPTVEEEFVLFADGGVQDFQRTGRCRRYLGRPLFLSQKAIKMLAAKTVTFFG